VQERWLTGALSRQDAQGTFIAQQTPMAEADRGGNSPRYWMDGWDGCPAARQRLLDGLAARAEANAVVLGGDVHTFMVTDLGRGPAGRPVASEFVTSSITAEGPAPERTARLVERNPHIHHARSDQRGYLLLESSQRACVVHLEAVLDVANPDSVVHRLASYAAKSGRPGAVPA
jgi:alkaline phosphatase D